MTRKFIIEIKLNGGQPDPEAQVRLAAKQISEQGWDDAADLYIEACEAHDDGTFTYLAGYGLESGVTP